MESILPFILLIAFVLTYPFLRTLSPVTQQANVSSQKSLEGIPKQQTAKREITQHSSRSTSNNTILIDTYITSGPKEGEIIENTNEIVFKFEAEVFPKNTKEKISFETKVEGLDNEWIKTYSFERTIKFPPGKHSYTFLVRAYINNTFDPTPAKRSFTIKISPYFGKIKISTVKQKTSFSPSLITLTTHLENEEKINLTGWQIKGKRGSFFFPKGTKRYHPFSNQTQNDDIIVKSGDTIYLSGTSNPLGRGINFRTNKCMGYLAEYYNFPIHISKNCPKLKKEDISHLSYCCQEYISKLRSCEIPNYSQNYKISNDSECVYFINNNLNYHGCFRKYFNDPDFLQKNWHIYTNFDIVVQNDCDTIYLRDLNGLFVDEYHYGSPVCK